MWRRYIYMSGLLLRPYYIIYVSHMFAYSNEKLVFVFPLYFISLLCKYRDKDNHDCIHYASFWETYWLLRNKDIPPFPPYQPLDRYFLRTQSDAHLCQLTAWIVVHTRERLIPADLHLLENTTEMGVGLDRLRSNDPVVDPAKEPKHERFSRGSPSRRLPW